MHKYFDPHHRQHKYFAIWPPIFVSTDIGPYWYPDIHRPEYSGIVPDTSPEYPAAPAIV